MNNFELTMPDLYVPARDRKEGGALRTNHWKHPRTARGPQRVLQRSPTGIRVPNKVPLNLY